MACESCAIKFTLFKRKKQCMDCLRHFCTDCVIRRTDRVLSCDNCSLLSRRPLIRTQVSQMKSKDLRHYLIAKKVCVKGCVEKEDLVNLLMQFANPGERQSNNGMYRTEPRPTSVPRETLSPNRSSNIENSPPRRSRSPPHSNNHEELASSAPSAPTIEQPQQPQQQQPSPSIISQNVEIIELSDGEESLTNGPEPLITLQEEVMETVVLEERNSDMITEMPMKTGHIKISEINAVTDIEYLSVKQLKELLTKNFVDYKGCVERHELLDKATRLWEEYKKSRKDIEALDEDSLCKICLDAPIECVILECGHMACCINCGKQMSECPICRQYVVRVVRFFKA